MSGERYMTFYHYTSREGRRFIQEEQVIGQSRPRRGNAYFGKGVYGTSLDPYTFSKTELARNNYDSYRGFWEEFLNLGRVDYAFEISLPRYRVRRVRRGSRDILLHKGKIDLSKYYYTIHRVSEAHNCRYRDGRYRYVSDRRWGTEESDEDEQTGDDDEEEDDGEWCEDEQTYDNDQEDGGYYDDDDQEEEVEYYEDEQNDDGDQDDEYYEDEQGDYYGSDQEEDDDQYESAYDEQEDCEYAQEGSEDEYSQQDEYARDEESNENSDDDDRDFDSAIYQAICWLFLKKH